MEAKELNLKIDISVMTGKQIAEIFASLAKDMEHSYPERGDLHRMSHPLTGQHIGFCILE